MSEDLETRMAPLERGAMFEVVNNANASNTPQCLLPQGQSFRGEIRLLNVLADPNNNNDVYVGSEGICRFPLAPGIGIVYMNINPMNIFFCGYGASGIIHATGGGIV